MKYRGQEYSKAAAQLETFVESEVGKYRGISIRYDDIKATVVRPAGRLKYRGVNI